MKKFEHIRITLIDIDTEIRDNLTAFGDAGWELVAVDHRSVLGREYTDLYWKRSLPATSEEGEEGK